MWLMGRKVKVTGAKCWVGWLGFFPLVPAVSEYLARTKLRWVVRTGAVWLLPSASLPPRVLLELKNKDQAVPPGRLWGPSAVGRAEM